MQKIELHAVKQKPLKLFHFSLVTAELNQLCRSFGHFASGNFLLLVRACCGEELVARRILAAKWWSEIRPIHRTQIAFQLELRCVVHKVQHLPVVGGPLAETWHMTVAQESDEDQMIDCNVQAEENANAAAGLTLGS
eukprot:2196524-Amphidinium_carterae.2